MLLQSIVKKRELPKEFEKLKKSKCKSAYTSTGDMIPFIQVNSTILRALSKYQAILDGTVPGGIAIDTNGRYLAEFYLSDSKTECAVYNLSNGSVMASIYHDGKMEPYNIEQEDLSLIILVLMEEILSDDEARDAYNNISTYLSFPKEIKDWDEFSDNVGVLTDNILSRLKVENKIYSIVNNFSKTSEITQIPDHSLTSKAFKVDMEFVGRMRIFKGRKCVITTQILPEDFNGKYKFSSVVYDEDQVAKIPDNYYVPDNIVEICNLIKNTTNLSPAFRDVLLYGDSGSGKTAGSYAIAAGLGLPYVTYTCHPQTDNFDLIGQFVPVTGEGSGMSIQEWMEANQLPSIDEIYADPKTAYKKITGKKRTTSVEAPEVVSELFKKVFKNRVSNGKDFVFVPSEIIEALKNGYLCEIQEPTVILNEGVLVGLNAILAGGYIRLANGERVYRHPDSVIVFTTNSADYAGYGRMSNSVLSRCSLVYKMDTPSIDEMVIRAGKKTGFSDRKLIAKMATCIADIAEKVKESGAKDGITGFRELINWISAYRIINDVVKAAYPAVINKASFDMELRNEIEDMLITEFSVM